MARQRTAAATWCFMLLLLLTGFLDGCGSTQGGAVRRPSLPTAGNVQTVQPCLRSVHGQIMSSTYTAPGFLPRSFHLLYGNPADANANPVEYESDVGLRGSRPWVEIHASDHPGPLASAIFGRGTARTVRVDGHQALLASLPAPFGGVDWKASSRTLISVTAWGISTSRLMRVANNLFVLPGGVINLPLRPHLVYGRAFAVKIAERQHPAGHGRIEAKLSSWTELQSMMQWQRYRFNSIRAPRWLEAAPWRPVWALLIPAGRPRSHSPVRIVLVSATTGAVDTFGTGSRPVWFQALTNRAPSSPGCPGGSSSRLPFGVLTRDEEAFTVRGIGPISQNGAHNRVILKLTTARVLSRHGLCGGPGDDCSIRELVWPSITVSTAAPGKTFQCPPAWQSVPGGFHRHWHSRKMSGISTANNSEGGCGPLPHWVFRLRDLAPPAG